MEIPEGSDAELHYFERMVEDCEWLLGPGIELRGLELDSNGVLLSAEHLHHGAVRCSSSLAA